MANRVWVFDLDGTLMDTLDLYRKPLERAHALIVEILGEKSPPLSEIKSRHSALDKELIYRINPLTKKPYLYTKCRFPTSFVEIFKILSKEAELELSAVDERRYYNQLYKIGMETFKKERYKRKIKSQVLPLVKFLSSQEDTLIILTKGDKGVQGDKRRVFKEVGLLRYFKEFIIVDDKKDRAFKDIRQRYPATEYYSVGDTYSWDILPAIKFGYFGIYTPSPANWMEMGKLKRIERRRSKINSNRYESLIEIKEKYRFL